MEMTSTPLHYYGQENLELLSFNIWLMRTIGIWPPDSDNKLLLAVNWIYITLMIVCFSIFSVCQILEIFLANNFQSMAAAVDLATLLISALFKLVYMNWYHKHFQRLVNRIDSAFVQKDFSLGTFTMSHWVRNSKLIITGYILMAAPFLFVIGGLFPGFLAKYFKRYQVFDEDIGEFVLSKQKMFTFRCWFPMDVTWSPLYEIIYVIEIVTLCTAGHLYLVSDSFFFMIVYLICGQLELLNATFRGMQESSTMKKMGVTSASFVTERRISLKEEGTEVKVFSDMRKCVEFHVTILEIIKDFEMLLRSMVLVDFIHAVVSLSFATLQMFISNTFLEWFQMSMFIAVCIIHQFLNNFFGEMLTRKQESVAEAVYETPWVEGTGLQKTTVYMTTAQANHPTRLSGWRMYHLGMETFVEFMKLLVSYVLVLQTFTK